MRKLMSFRKAAQEVLKQANKSLTAKEITELALQKGLIHTAGKTPEATMGAQLYVDIKSNKNSPFIQMGRGLFSLKSDKEIIHSPLSLIRKQKEETKKILKEKLREMDPYQFEYFVADLLKEIGYEDIEVTKKSGDGGIDILASLTAGELTKIPAIIQVKRFKNNVTGKVVRELRGSAKVGQGCLVITTSDFTKDAISEARAESKIPVALVNGEKLLELLLDTGVGVKKEEKTVYSVDNSYFQSDTLISSDFEAAEKNRSLWPLPGGYDKYIYTLNQFLEAISKGLNTKMKLVKWYKKQFETVQSEKTATGYIFVPKSMGLIDVQNGIYSLTVDGKKYMQTKSLKELYKIICKHIYAFEEIVEFLKTAKEAQTEKDILEYLKENFDITWTTFAQINFRLIWLINLKKIDKTAEGYKFNHDES